VLWTRKALWPEGIMWRVFLFEPKPICDFLCQSFLFSLPFAISMSALGVAIVSVVAGYSKVEHTEGMTIWPLNRRRTRLSIPFGFLHADGTHLKRSDWWRNQDLVCFFTIGTCFFAETIWKTC
jgi:hypothetical protein